MEGIESPLYLVTSNLTIRFWMEQLSANRSSRLVMIDQSQTWRGPFFCSTHHMLKTVWKEICFSMGPQQGACFRKLNSPEEKTENVSTCRWLNFVMENQFQTIREKQSWNLTNHSSQNRQATIFFYNHKPFNGEFVHGFPKKTQREDDL